MLIGYSRVSTTDQNLDLQTDALTKVGCDKIFRDVATAVPKLIETAWLRPLTAFVKAILWLYGNSIDWDGH